MKKIFATLCFVFLLIVKQGYATDPYISVTGITLASPPAKIYIGEERKIYINVLPDTASNPTINWSSSDNQVVSMEQFYEVHGNTIRKYYTPFVRIRALKAGTTTITGISDEGGFSVKTVVTVVGNLDFSVVPNATVVGINEPLILSCKLRPDDGSVNARLSGIKLGFDDVERNYYNYSTGTTDYYSWYSASFTTPGLYNLTINPGISSAASLSIITITTIPGGSESYISYSNDVYRDDDQILSFLTVSVSGMFQYVCQNPTFSGENFRDNILYQVDGGELFLSWPSISGTTSYLIHYSSSKEFSAAELNTISGITTIGTNIYNFSNFNTASDSLFLKIANVAANNSKCWSGVKSIPWKKEQTAVLNSLKSNIILFPNPAKDFINFSGIQPGIPIEIRDLSGRVLLNGTTPCIKMISLNPGIYFVKVDGVYVRIIKD